LSISHSELLSSEDRSYVAVSGRFLQFCPWDYYSTLDYYILQVTLLSCQGGYVFTGVCLSFCSSVSNFTQKHDRILVKVLPEMCLYTKTKNWLNVGGLAHLFPDWVIFKDSQRCKTFSTFWLIAWKLTGSSWKLYRRCVFGQILNFKFWKLSGSYQQHQTTHEANGYHNSRLIYTRAII